MSSQTPSASDGPLLDHDCDGIQEYDYPVPGWLMALFIATIVFSLGYVIYYGFNLGPSLQSEYLQESKVLEAQWAEYYADHPLVPPSNEELVAAAQDPNLIDSGRQQFAKSCAPCHGERAEGLIGPNLTDEFWLRGGKLTEIYSTVVTGVSERGMPPWGRALAPDQIKAVVAYLRTLQGTNPAGGKPPEGARVVPKPI